MAQYPILPAVGLEAIAECETHRIVDLYLMFRLQQFFQL